MLLHKIKKDNVTVLWVQNDLTFFYLIKNLNLIKSLTKINFYEFKCQGFNFKGIKFKSINLKVLTIEKSLLHKKELDMHTNFCFTYGAFALKILKHLIKEGKIIETKILHEQKKAIRTAYAGGRNEYIQIPQNTNPLYSVDFNMMYYNCFNDRFLTGAIQKENAEKIDKPGFYYIRYESINMEYPILYQLNKHTEQNVYCNGIGEGLFWYEEIELFVNEGGIIHKIFYRYVGETYINNYAPYIAEISLYKTKKVIKALANNLYGKLAMKDFFYKCILLEEEEFLLKNVNNTVGRWIKWYDYYICEDILYTTYSDYTDIVTAAALTSKARIKLFCLIKNLKNVVTICLLNTDEIIFTCEKIPSFLYNEMYKLQKIEYKVFEAKKNMYQYKRYNNNLNQTRPFNLKDGMLL